MPELTDLDHTVTDDIVLVVSELASNAVSAADPGTAIYVDVERGTDSVTVAVENMGPPLDRDVPMELPAGSALRGRGLAIVSLLTESVHVTSGAGRTRVAAHCRLTGR